MGMKMNWKPFSRPFCMFSVVRFVSCMSHGFFFQPSLDSRLYPPKTQLLYRAFRRTLPSFIANFLLRFPTKEEKRFLVFLNASKRVARGIFESASKDNRTTEEYKESKDILSILLRSNQELDPKKSLDMDEVLSQMA